MSRDEFIYKYSVTRWDHVYLRKPANCEYPWLPNLKNDWINWDL